MGQSKIKLLPIRFSTSSDEIGLSLSTNYHFLKGLIEQVDWSNGISNAYKKLLLVSLVKHAIRLCVSYFSKNNNLSYICTITILTENKLRKSFNTMTKLKSHLIIELRRENWVLLAAHPQFHYKANRQNNPFTFYFFGKTHKVFSTPYNLRIK